MSQPRPEELQTVGDVYRVMAELRYRPEAPSDGLGNITVPEDELNLDDEVARYTRRWSTDEDARSKLLGVPDRRSLRGLVLVIEAARLMSSADPRTAIRLLERAIQELEPAIDG